VTIKGTLETFNLLDLLQMLAFNQKVGTLLLETARGPRTLYVESGAIGFVQGDEVASASLARVLRRTGGVAPDRLQRGLAITANSGRFLGDALQDLGVLDAESRTASWMAAVEEMFFDLLQTALARFEFVEHKRLAPNGTEGAAIEPLCGVDGLLLDMTRKVDEWTVLRRTVSADEEVYEGTGVAAAEPAPEDRLPEYVATRVLPLVDGRRTVTALVAESDCDRFSVVKLVAVLLKQGALRSAATGDLVARAEDLLARGEAAKAVHLLRRAVDRGEAAPTVRVRLADALEAAGDLRGAAVELDTYAAARAEPDPVGVFDALRRTMRLRGGDASAAARICDHYLRHRSRLVDRAGDAQEALRRLIHAASTGGKPLEAASRLAPFLEHGDAPSEDLLVLADLCAAGGKPQEAASALFRRAELLIEAGRPGPARDLLRRALGYDATRADARRRLGEIEGQERRRKHRRRVVALLLLIGVVAGTAGGVYVAYDGRAARVVEGALARAEAAVKDADARATRVLADWNAKVVEAMDAAGTVADVVDGAAVLRSETQRIATELRGTLSSIAAEVGSGPGGGRVDAGLSRLRGLEARMRSLVARADASVADVAEKSARALEEGEKAYANGKFRAARRLLVQSINLGFDDATRTARAKARLDLVAAYEASFEKAKATFEAALAKQDEAGAWREGCRLLATLLDSDLTREVLLPVPVTSDPRGAFVRLGRETLPLQTPCLLRYSPFGDLDLHLRAPGRVPKSFALPSFDEICRAEASRPREPLAIRATLEEGARWVAAPRGGAYSGPFVAGDSILAVGADGRRIFSVRAVDGATADARGIAVPPDRTRGAGRLGTLTWLLVGLRTFWCAPDGASPWQYQTLGRLERAPAAGQGLVVVVDQRGTAYGLDAATGSLRWKCPLPGEPSQAPQASALGFLVTTVGGDAVAIDPASGALKLLVPPAKRPLIAVPWPGGALVVGGDAAGGKGGLRRVAADLTVSAFGDADVQGGSTASLSPDGLAWIGADGRARWLGHGASVPTALDGLGRPASAPAVADGAVYAVGGDGVLRAARLDAPAETAWRSALPGAPQTDPLVHGDLVLLRTDQGVVAVER
jgi:hypothetical protein